MLETARQLKFTALGSELEALLIEAELIRVHQPGFNILLKDDKSKLYLWISQHRYPRIIPLRKREILRLHPRGHILGPFPSSYKLQEVMKIARRIFPWCEHPERAHGPHRACFYYHLSQCPGVCLGEVTAEEYQQNIQDLKLFLKGKTSLVIKQLMVQMKSLAAVQQFEQAQKIRDSIMAIKAVTDPKFRLQPDLHLPALASSPQREGLAQLGALLRNYLPLPANYLLVRIEGYDVSNFQGLNAAVAMVVFHDGESTPDQYRLFNIQADQANDYAMLSQAVTRRQRHPEWGRPDLILIDGGKGQVRAVLRHWRWHCPVIGLAKNPDRIVIPLDAVPGATSPRYQILKLPSDHPALQLLQQVRDEAHRFGRQQYRRRHSKAIFT